MLSKARIKPPESKNELGSHNLGVLIFAINIVAAM